MTDKKPKGEIRPKDPKSTQTPTDAELLQALHDQLDEAEAALLGKNKPKTKEDEPC